jgi:hypothetical protein
VAVSKLGEGVGKVVEDENGEEVEKDDIVAGLFSPALVAMTALAVVEVGRFVGWAVM